MVEIEEKRPGSSKKFLLKNMQRNIRATDLYNRLVVLSERDVFYTMEKILETREAYISKLIDTVLRYVG